MIATRRILVIIVIFNLNFILKIHGGGEFCGEHGLLESKCFICDPSLEQTRPFCAEHGVSEARCYLCDKDLIPAFKSIKDWCSEHDRPESQCQICNPKMGNPFVPVATVSISLTPSPLPASATAVCQTHEQRVRLADPEVAKNIGLLVEKTARRPVSKIISCLGRIGFNESLTAKLSSRVSGFIHTIARDIGYKVNPGEVLADIDSYELSEAKGEFIALGQGVRFLEDKLRRETELKGKGMSTESEILGIRRELSEGQVKLNLARQKLLHFGFGVPDLERIASSGDTSPHWSIKAPFAGTLIARQGVLGETVERERILFELTDPSEMWLFVEIPERHLGRLPSSAGVQFSPSGDRARKYEGVIDWVAPRVDPHTRTLKARARLNNADGFLRSEMIGDVSVKLLDNQSVLFVPKEAVQWEGCCHLVFIPISAVMFEPRKVSLGNEFPNHYEILSGLSEGEDVVTRGSFIFKTELLKGSIGAGCCD